MKFDDQLAAYLYQNKILKLEGIGTFTLDERVSVPADQEKQVYYPIEGLSFTYNPKNETDENLIQFLVTKLHKIQPLIRSDLESYLSNIKQFINLGKPYTIEGIGTLSKNNRGDYEFTPGNFLPVKEELNPIRENEEHNYPARSQSSAARIFVVILIIVAALAALGGIGWGVSSLITKYHKPKENIPQQGYVDTLPEETLIDTSEVDADTALVQLKDYKMVFEITRYKDRARTRTAQLNQFGTQTKVDTIFIRDSLRYRLYVPVTISPADTTRYKDSLSLLLGARIRILQP